MPREPLWPIGTAIKAELQCRSACIATPFGLNGKSIFNEGENYCISIFPQKGINATELQRELHNFASEIQQGTQASRLCFNEKPQAKCLKFLVTLHRKPISMAI